MNCRIRNLFCAVGLLLFAGLGYAGPVNINTADADTLAAELSGVGPALAAAIVSDRQANGLFPTADALTRVRGIGPHIVELNRANILVEDSKTR